MLKNYLRVGLRSMRAQSAYTAINILGLTIGMVSAILIALFVRFEMSFDSDIDRIDRVYRVVQRQPGNVYLGSDQFVVTMAPLANVLKSEVPGIEAATLFNSRSGLLSLGDKHFYESGLVADEGFFDVFGFELLEGTAERVLAEPENIVLTASLAERMFGDANAIGLQVTFDNGSGTETPYVVTGVVADPPENSHIQFSFVGSILGTSNYKDNLDRWNNSSWYTYYLIQEGQNPAEVSATIQGLPAKYYADDDPAERREFLTQSALSVHLHSNINFDIATNGDLNFVYLLGAIGLVILLLASVNYVNLAIARSVQRSKEVGVRKVVGARRRQLVAQFLSQSFVTAVFAAICSVAVVAVVLPKFSSHVERSLSLFEDGWAGLVTLVVGFVFLVGLVGGIYPALVASRMNPARILKGNVATGKAGSGVRRILVTLQFVVSVTLIAATLVIFDQMRFIDSKELGYRKDHVLTAYLQDRELRTRLPEIEATLKSNPNVISVSASNHSPTRIASSTSAREFTGSKEGDLVRIYQTTVGYDFLDIYEIPVAMGRGFSRDYPADDSLEALVINETAFRAFGWSDIEGKSIKNRPVVGVVKDFHMHSLRLEVMPLMMLLSADEGGQLSIKITAADPVTTAGFVEATLTEMSDYPIELQWVDDMYAQMYEDDRTLSQTIGLFTVLALAIGALGLFGLVAYSAETRTKEIGVRKVLGASVYSVLRLFAAEYAGLIVMAGLIGIPAAYVLMSRWLEQFAYRIELGPFDFLISIGILCLVAAASMTYQTLRAATRDPVQALRYE